MVYVLALTSCARLDLLKRTLESFIACVETLPQRILILEDSDSDKPDWLTAPEWRARNVQWISNGRRMGQAYSVNRLIDELARLKPVPQYVMWLEDDWQFVQNNFLVRSKEILDKHPEVISVSLRGSKCNGHPLANDARFPVLIQEPNWSGGWGHFSFNPALMRMKHLQEAAAIVNTNIGQHGLSCELELSKHFGAQGYVIAALQDSTGKYEPFVVHTGEGRSRAIEPIPVWEPKLLIAVPTCQRLEYGCWQSEDSPQYDPATNWERRPYGVGMHWDRDNDQTQAVRDTWWKDAAQNPDATARFFYGIPAGETRESLLTKWQPQADEVLLDVPDDYAHLPHKTVAICRWALEHGFEYLFKCDTDTFVLVDRLLREIHDNPRLQYGGCDNATTCTGGPGYILSRKAIQAVVNAGAPIGWAEDRNVGRVLANAGFKAENLPGHRPGYPAHWYFWDGTQEKFNPAKVDADLVTCHAVFPAAMRECWAHLNPQIA